MDLLETGSGVYYSGLLLPQGFYPHVYTTLALTGVPGSERDDEGVRTVRTDSFSDHTPASKGDSGRVTSEVQSGFHSVSPKLGPRAEESTFRHMIHGSTYRRDIDKRGHSVGYL